MSLFASAIAFAFTIAGCKPSAESPGSVISRYEGTELTAVRIDMDTTAQRTRERWYTRDGKVFTDVTFWEGFPWDGQAIVEVGGLKDFLVVTFANGERRRYRVLEEKDILKHRQSIERTVDGGSYASITCTMEEVDKMPFPTDIIKEAVIRTAEEMRTDSE
jgi:hypothetical protein